MTQPNYPQQQQQGQQPYPQQFGQPYPQQPGQQGAPKRKRHILRNLLIGAAGVIAVIVVISVALSAGGHKITTRSTTTGAGSGKVSSARVGSAITLAGNTSGEQMSVTVVRTAGNAKPGDELTSAPKNDRLYAVQFRLGNTGSAAYSDAPSNGAAVTDSKGQSYSPSITDSARGCQGFPVPENIAPGADGLGCIVFEVPKSAKITGVQFTLDSGLGPQTGQWKVG